MLTENTVDQRFLSSRIDELGPGELPPPRTGND
jgi:hypothetical protein